MDYFCCALPALNRIIQNTVVLQRGKGREDVTMSSADHWQPRRGGTTRALHCESDERAQCATCSACSYVPNPRTVELETLPGLHRARDQAAVRVRRCIARHVAIAGLWSSASAAHSTRSERDTGHLLMLRGEDGAQGLHAEGEGEEEGWDRVGGQGQKGEIDRMYAP
ncbi:hypothetical protein K438DRAFT_1965079 [Mycena galopus ATCC 62051]|nr:hypothetical protein K438DRAFT_1965079 [Mycena galopus ATCC 62051]